MKKLILLCLIALCAGSTAFANEWYQNTGIIGQDSDWYNPLNWGDGHIPTAGETVEWRYASTGGGIYAPIVISGGTAVSAASTCGIWYTGTAQLTVTNAATYNISGGLNLYDSSSDLPHSPANSTFTVNGGSTVTMTTDSQIGRNFGFGDGQVTINVDGAGSLLHQTGGYMWLGWGVGQTPNVLLSVTDGGLAQFDTVGGPIIQQDGSRVKISIHEGTIKVAGNRTGQLGGYKGSGWIVGYDGTSASVGIEWGGAGDDYTYITSIVPPPPPVPPTIPTVAEVTIFWDDFDSYLPGTMFPGDPIAGQTPPVGTLWSNPGFDPFGVLLDNTIGNDGNSAAFNRTNTGPIWLYTYGMPDVYRTPDFTYRFEYDVYLPSTGGVENSQVSFFVSCGTTSGHENFLGWTTGYYSHNFAISDGWTFTTDTGIPVPYDEWFSMRIDVYDNNTVWMWYTPADGNETVIDANRPWSFDYGQKVRGYFGDPSADTPPAYIDNYRAQMIDNTPMGYPVVHPNSQTITIDGTVDLGTEWADVKKVATKPVGAKGNFNPVPGAGWWQGLAEDTTVDVYMGYDDDFFYAAIVGNNMTTTGRVATVFSWQEDDANAVNYIFRQFAAHAVSEPNDVGASIAINYTGDTAMPDPNAFGDQGGQMAYTVDSNTIEAEFKIPFTLMPEFGSTATDKKLDLQFNYVEQSDGDHRATTNTIGSVNPDTTYYLGRRAAPLTGGISFLPTLGDFDESCLLDLLDLKTFVDNWLIGSSIADLNNDDGTDFEDYVIFTNNWYDSSLCD